MDFSKDQIEQMPVFFDRYIDQIGDTPLIGALVQTRELFQIIPQAVLNDLADKAYAPGKWTVKDIIQHLLDMERVLAFRALTFARNDPAPRPGIDEHLYASHAGAGSRSLEVLADDFRFQRQSTTRLFESFTPDMVRRSGIAAGKRISVLALGFVIAGHTLHHLRIIREKYIPLIYEIRSLDNTYREQILDLILPIQQIEFNVPVTLEGQPDLLDIETHYHATGGGFWGMFHHDELIGTIALISTGYRSGALRKMFVKKEFRGKERGVAQQLLNTLASHCKAHDIFHLYLGTIDVLKAAHRFYERNGFRRVSKEDLPSYFPTMMGENVYYRLQLT